MTSKEKDYLMEMLFGIVDRSERDYEEYLYRINSSVDTYTLYKALVSLVEYKSYSYAFRCISQLIKCSQFSDNKPIVGKSATLLADSRLTSEQDDLIYNYALYVLHNKNKIE